MENKELKTKNGTPLLPNGSKLFNTEYVIESYITSGGYGDVYRIRNTKKPSVKLAAKIIYKNKTNITDEGWKRIGFEAVNSIRVLSKPNLVQTYHAWNLKDDTGNDVLVLIMDYVEGISLREYLFQQGCIVPRVALNIFLKILNGIKILHNFKRQIIHRDLKPENIMLSYDLSKVTIVDFGIANVIDSSEQVLVADKKKRIFNAEGDLFGTIEYVCPDALKEYSKKDPQDRIITTQFDYYSLGVILYEMIIGKKPFDYSALDSTKLDYKRRAIETPLKYDMLNISANPSIPASLENIIFRLIASKPEDKQFRYNNIDEIINDVKKAMLLLNKNDPTPLLKPVHKRIYQKANIFNLDVVKTNQKFYKQWWFIGLITGLALVFLIACIVLFFVV